MISTIPIASGCAECVEIALVVAGLRDPDWCLISTIPITGGCAECVEIALVVVGLRDPDWCLISTIPTFGESQSTAVLVVCERQGNSGKPMAG